VLLVCASVASDIWLWLQLDQGWVPHDDGSFAQSALRVLDGQLPHREFAELYTGGLTFLNAATIHLFGEDLIVLRYPLFLLSLGLVPATYYIARSVTGSTTAVLASLVAGTWSIPIYPAAVPSWYVLLLAVYAAAALVRWRATGHDRWLLICGLLAGLSVCVKVVGVYLVVAVLLVLLFVHPRRRAGPQWRAVLDPASLCAIAVVAGVVAAVLGERHGRLEIVNLVAPIAAVTLVAVVERARAPVVDAVRRTSLSWNVVVFTAGLIVPVAALALPYVIHGASRDLVEGVFISPQSRRDRSYIPTPETDHLLPALGLVAVVFVRSRLSHRPRTVLDVLLGMVVVTLLAAAGDVQLAYEAFWVTARGMAPVIAVVGAVILLRSHARDNLREIAFLLLVVAALMGLVQFPFGAPVYYSYVAPLVVLAVVGVVGMSRLRQGAFVPGLLAAFCLFGAWYLDRVAIFDLGQQRFVVDSQTVVLDAERASIRVYPWDREQLTTVVNLIRAHADGRPIYAGPDLPHIYFLADEENRTRSLFDFLDTTDSARGAKLVRFLERSRVNVVAIYHAPEFSEPLDSETLQTLRSMYSREAVVGNIEVRWSDMSEPSAGPYGRARNG